MCKYGVHQDKPSEDPQQILNSHWNVGLENSKEVSDGLTVLIVIYYCY
jgi:hypothetical protein